jgi:nucleoid-associated protein YgaU
MAGGAFRRYRNPLEMPMHQSMVSTLSHPVTRARRRLGNDHSTARPGLEGVDPATAPLAGGLRFTGLLVVGLALASAGAFAAGNTGALALTASEAVEQQTTTAVPSAGSPDRTGAESIGSTPPTAPSTPATARLEARIRELERTLAQRDAVIARLQAADARRTQAREQLEARLSELRARLPAPEGGTLTAAEARERAEQDAATLERLASEGQGIHNPQLWQQIREAENALHHDQFLLARAEGARTVYRVRPGDSLPRISALFYGDDGEWSRIFEANRHLLEDPNRLHPGLTLVIP